MECVVAESLRDAEAGRPVYGIVAVSPGRDILERVDALGRRFTRVAVQESHDLPAVAVGVGGELRLTSAVRNLVFYGP